MNKRVVAGLISLGLLALAILAWRGFKQPGPGADTSASGDPATNKTVAGTSPSTNHPRGGQDAARASTNASVRTAGFGTLIESLSADPVERAPQIQALIAGMSTSKRLEALEQLWSEEAKGAQRELADEILRKWAGEMPQAAAEWLSRKPQGPMQREAAQGVATIWANASVADAAGWVRQWPGDEREAGLLAVAYEAARSSPAEALWLASELSPTVKRDELISHASREWASNDGAATIAWADKMENSSLKEQVYAGAAISLSETNAAAAAEIALKRLSPGTRQDNTLVSIVQRWAQTQPEAAADWVVRFPEGQLRESALENLVQLWSDQQPAAAADWLNRLEDGPVRDVGLAAYARKLAPTDPESAMQWVETIADSELRQNQYESLVSLWMHSDRQGASAWVQASSLPSEVKARMTQNENAPKPGASPEK